jgi:hypothetical protein
VCDNDTDLILPMNGLFGATDFDLELDFFQGDNTASVDG